MTGRASGDVTTNLVFKMLRYIVISCCVVLCVGHNLPTKNVEGSLSDAPQDASRVRNYTDSAEVICKGENEVFTDCRKSCPPNTCLSIAASFQCDRDEPCKKGCLCKPGYLKKHPDSPCVPTCQCDEMKNAPECQNQGIVTNE